jgi:hypothetical protein
MASKKKKPVVQRARGGVVLFPDEGPMKKYLVTLPTFVVELARKIGGGSLSRGIRKIVDRRCPR